MTAVIGTSCVEGEWEVKQLCCVESMKTVLDFKAKFSFKVPAL